MHRQEVLLAFDIETKGLTGLRRYSKELFGSNLILEGDYKELLSLLATSMKKVGYGHIMEYLHLFSIFHRLMFNTHGERLTNVCIGLLMRQ